MQHEDSLMTKRKAEDDVGMDAVSGCPTQIGGDEDYQQDHSVNPAKLARFYHQPNRDAQQLSRYKGRCADPPSNYSVWWGHDGMELAENFDWKHGGQTQSYTMEQLRTEIGDRVVTHMKIDGVVPPDLHVLAPQLGHLSVESAELPFVMFSITELGKLKVLCLNKCDFSSGLPSSVSHLESLQELTVTHCQLTELPPSISQLTSLDRLNINYNNFSAGLPNIISEFVLLKELHLSYCKLTNLPQIVSQLTALERLDVSYNNFSMGLPNVISELVSLKTLLLTHCELSDLPQTLVQLEHLELLGVKSNLFIHVPTIVFELKQLQTLDLTMNASLQTLDSRIINMSQLIDIRLGCCNALRSPPLAVCKQGLQAILQYYTAIASGTCQKVLVATVAVIGNSLAGKTSLIKTLKCPLKERKLTHRDRDALHDEATKVFNVQEVKVKDTVLRFIDMGGHEIYHVTHQLMLRQNCVPMLVVNIEEYKRQADANGAKEAVRSVCFSLISHLYLLQPKMEFPKLVLTHKDKVENFQELRDQFLDAAKSFRNSIILEEGQLQKKSFSQISHFSNSDTPVFKPEDIFAIGGAEDPYEVFDTIKSSVYQACQQHVRTIPMIWEEIDHSLQSRDGCFCTVDELFSEFHQTHKVNRCQLEIVLEYLHDTGKLLWYKDIPALSQIIFHNIEKITKVLSVLCDHNTNVWQDRVDKLHKHFTAGEDIEYYTTLVDSFRETGIMNRNLLWHILRAETSFKTIFELEIASTFLTSFRLIYGPVYRDTEILFLIPCYAAGILDHVHDGENDLTFQVDILFKGLALPQYVYYQMTTVLLEMFLSETDTPVMKENGAAIVNDNTAISLIHDFKMRKVTIYLSANIERIGRSWRQLMDITNDIIKHTSSTYSTSRMVCIFYCPHCLLKGDSKPRTTVNPSWCALSDTRADADQHYRFYSGIEPVVCGGTRDVPKPLKFPCIELTPAETEELKTYIWKLRESKTTHHPVQGALEETAPVTHVGDEAGGPDVTDHVSGSHLVTRISSLESRLNDLTFNLLRSREALVDNHLEIDRLRSINDRFDQLLKTVSPGLKDLITAEVPAEPAQQFDRKLVGEERKQWTIRGAFIAAVFQRDKAGRTLLHDAKDREIAVSLLKGIEQDKQRELLLAGDKRQQTALHVAAEYGRTDVVEYLIDCYKAICVESPDDLVLKRDIQANTALHYADNREIAELLLNAVVPDQQRTLLLASNVYRRTAVHKAAKECRTDVVKYLTTTTIYRDILKDSILGRDFKGNTALHYACNGDIAKLLVDAVVPNQRLGFLLANDHSQKSALHTAANYGRTDVVECLCDPTLADDRLMLKRDQTGRTALYYASDKTTAAVLIGAVGDKLGYLNMVDNDGNTAVMYHISSGSRVDVVSYILHYINKPYEKDLKQHMQHRNSKQQNSVHLIGISPYINEFSKILLEYLPKLDIENLMQPDAYGNTPLSYVASRYSTKTFAEFIMRMSLAQRNRFVLQTNMKGVDCRSIVQREQFSEPFYLSSVLCDQKGGKGQIDYFWAFESSFHEDFKYDENMLKVLKYALNEYSLLDSIFTIPHSQSLSAMFIKQGSSDADTLKSTSNQFSVDTDRLDVSAIQQGLNDLDVPDNHGKPKVVIIRTLDATGISKLTPPGPDFLIVSTLYTKLSNTRFSSVPSVNALVDELRRDVNVECVSVNSTLGRRYLRDVSESESSVVMSPVDQILISGRNRGKALIICNRRNRYDWQQEFEHANHVLTYHFGLQVEHKNDLAVHQIPEAISRFSNSAGHGSLVALVIMSHGDHHGNIAGDDGESTVSVQEVMDSLCAPQLETTPKVVLLSFSRGYIQEVNRTIQSFECTTLASMVRLFPIEDKQQELSGAELMKEREIHRFPSLDVPLNCYVCFSTLPDSRSCKGTMFRCFTEYLTDLYKHSPLRKNEDVNAETRREDIDPETRSGNTNRETRCEDIDPEIRSEDVDPGIRREDIDPETTREDVDPDTSVYERELPRVELIELFTDVAGVVRETSQFTQYMNYCYKLNKDSQPVVIEIIPIPTTDI